MAGFGLKKALKLSEDSIDHGKKSEYFDYILLGDHFIIPFIFHKIRENQPTARVTLISTNSFFNQDFIQQEYLRYINNPCSNDQVSYYQDFKELGVNFHSTEECLFYKDSKFHPFGQRVKNFELKGAENHLKNLKGYISFSEMYQNLDLQAIMDELQKIRSYDFPHEIKLVNPTDLIDQANFKLTLKSQKIIESKYLLNFENPKLMEKILKVEDRAVELSQFYSSMHAESYISLLQEIDQTLLAEKEIDLKSLQYFIPQSTIHESGHYLLLPKGPYLLSYFFIDEDVMANEEDIARKIRHYKSTVNRIFPSLKETIVNEMIFVNHNGYLRLHSKEDYLKIKKLYHRLFNFFDVYMVEDNEGNQLSENNLLLELSSFLDCLKTEVNTKQVITKVKESTQENTQINF